MMMVGKTKKNQERKKKKSFQPAWHWAILNCFVVEGIFQQKVGTKY